jgi:murein DD-endopeptidase MepM/ murein hydrolase activator NlpD
MLECGAMRKTAQLLCAAAALAALSACGGGPKPWWDGGPATPNSGVYGVPMAPPGRGYSDSVATSNSSHSRGAYVVRGGDTVYSISRKHNVPLRSLIDANNLQPPYGIRTGQRLTIPTGRYYTVARGDTVYSISRKYSVDTTTLTQLNKIPAPYTISIGQRLQLPSQSRVASRSEQAAPPIRPGTPAPRPTPGTTIAKTPLPKPPLATGEFIWPAQGKIVSNFGSTANGLHNDGINIAVPSGTPVKASQSGVVAYAGNELKGYGNLLLIRHSDGWMTAYANNSKLLVQRGATVTRGQTIANAGSTGSVTSPQVHFEIRKDSKAVDPRNYIRD